jgi:hypothetical protein
MLLHELMAQGNLKMFGLVPVLGLFITGAFAVASISNNALGTTDEDIVHKFGHAQNAAKLGWRNYIHHGNKVGYS